MAACSRQRCLYVADSGRDAVYRVDKTGESTVWQLADKPTAVSVTRAGLSMTHTTGHLLVTFAASRTLREYLPDGRLLRKIQLDVDIDSPWHAFEASRRRLVTESAEVAQFVVAHGSGYNTDHRVCLVDDEGHAAAVFPGNFGHDAKVNCPTHLALCDDAFVFVLDSVNKRVLLLDSELEYIRDVVSEQHGLDDPRRICWDGLASRLYVGEGAGTILVFEICP